MAKITLETVKKVTPQCYAYILPEQNTHKGWTKIGFTERDVETRVKEQTHTAGLTPKICWAMRASYMTQSGKIGFYGFCPKSWRTGK